MDMLVCALTLKQPLSACLLKYATLLHLQAKRAHEIART